MARFSARLHPVHSLKHIVDTATSAIPGGVTTTVILAESKTSPSLSAVTEVNDGSTINAVFLRVEIVHNSGTFTTIPRIYMMVFKNPGNNLALPFPGGAGASDAKRYIIHQEMAMITQAASDAGTFPRTLFQGVVKLPPRLKRMGYNDRLQIGYSLDVAESTGIINVCTQCIYKEFQ